MQPANSVYVNFVHIKLHLHSIIFHCIMEQCTRLKDLHFCFVLHC